MPWRALRKQKTEPSDPTPFVYLCMLKSSTPSFQVLDYVTVRFFTLQFVFFVSLARYGITILLHAQHAALQNTKISQAVEPR